MWMLDLAHIYNDLKRSGYLHDERTRPNDNGSTLHINDDGHTTRGYHNPADDDEYCCANDHCPYDN